MTVRSDTGRPIGAGTVVHGDFHSINVGDSSEVNLGGANSNGISSGVK